MLCDIFGQLHTQSGDLLMTQNSTSYAPLDPRYDDQWHFDMIGDMETVWADYTGEGVQVLVMDNGVEATHPDLIDTYNADGNFTYNGKTYDGMPLDGVPDSGSTSDHGTAVAGIIAAANNDIGGVGVAYGSDLTSFDYLTMMQEQGTSDMILSAYLQTANFDVVNHSYGMSAESIDFDPYYSPVGGLMRYTFVRNFDAGMMASLHDGRDGLGTIQIFAAGNESMNTSGSYSTNHRATVVVGATDWTGDATYYSNFGVSLMIAAPSASVTTDRTGGDGYNDGDYTSTFNGTSASAPVVSGVAALILDANEDLGWRDVNRILALSAQQTGSDYGTSGTGHEQGDWSSNSATSWNGGGLSYHLSYGYGMVDAFAATRLAEVWNTFYTDSRTLHNEKTLSIASSTGSGAIQDGGEAAISATAAGGFEIESAYVTVQVNSYDLNSISLYLLTPAGQQLMLMDLQTVCGASEGDLQSYEYTFHVNGLLGMDSAGAWSVLLVDNEIDSEVSALAGFSIEFFGESDSVDDVYHFTQDYADLLAVEGDRAVISDTDGGTDWLNFAMLDGSVLVNLDTGLLDLKSAGTGSVVPGTIENLMGGQAGDQLLGDDGANEIHGNDGDDILRGQAGNDLLFGDAGADTLYGGHGFDYLYGGAGNDTLYGGNSRDRLMGKDGDDLLEGGGGKDNLFGGRGDDILLGQTSHDRLSGGKGQDDLDGGTGNDTLIGGGGTDVFRFSADCGQDEILDFSVAEGDLIVLSLALAGSVTDAFECLQVSGDDLVFDFGEGNMLTLVGLGADAETNNVLDQHLSFA